MTDRYISEDGTATLMLLHAHYDPDHLEQVKREMAELGAPTLRAVVDDVNGVYCLLEGCHRARAAEALGCRVVLDVVDPFDHDTECPLAYIDTLPGLDCDSDSIDDLLNNGSRGRGWVTVEADVL